MLILDNDPELAAKATPVPLISTTCVAFDKAWDVASGKSTLSVLKPNSTEYLIFMDLVICNANIEWYKKYISIIKPYSEVPTKVSIKDIDFSNILVSYLPDYFQTFLNQPLLLHNPLEDNSYLDIISKNPEKYDKVSECTILSSRLLLADMAPQYEDFIGGVPSWLKDMMPYAEKYFDEVVSAYDSVNRRHIKITKDGDNYRYFTSVISDNWVEIEGVPKDMKIIMDYILSHKLSLTNKR